MSTFAALSLALIGGLQDSAGLERRAGPGLSDIVGALDSSISRYRSVEASYQWIEIDGDGKRTLVECDYKRFGVVEQLFAVRRGAIVRSDRVDLPASDLHFGWRWDGEVFETTQRIGSGGGLTGRRLASPDSTYFQGNLWFAWQRPHYWAPAKLLRTGVDVAATTCVSREGRDLVLIHGLAPFPGSTDRFQAYFEISLDPARGWLAVEHRYFGEPRGNEADDYAQAVDAERGRRNVRGLDLFLQEVVDLEPVLHSSGCWIPRRIVVRRLTNRSADEYVIDPELVVINRLTEGSQLALDWGESYSYYDEFQKRAVTKRGPRKVTLARLREIAAAVEEERLEPVGSGSAQLGDPVASHCGANVLAVYFLAQGLDVDVAALARATSVDEAQRESSLATLAAHLTSRGMDARGVHVALEDLDSIRQPVIVHLAKPEEPDIGHFVLLVPSARSAGARWVVDPPFAPALIKDLRVLEDAWTGNCLVLDPIRDRRADASMGWPSWLGFALGGALVVAGLLPKRLLARNWVRSAAVLVAVLVPLSCARRAESSFTCLGPTTIDLGRRQLPLEVDVPFRFVNRSPDVMTITDPRKSCSCQEIAIDKTTIRPGEEAAVTVTLSEARRQGHLDAIVWFTTSPPAQQHVLHVRADLFCDLDLTLEPSRIVLAEEDDRPGRDVICRLFGDIDAAPEPVQFESEPPEASRDTGVMVRMVAPWSRVHQPFPHWECRLRAAVAARETGAQAAMRSGAAFVCRVRHGAVEVERKLYVTRTHRS